MSDKTLPFMIYAEATPNPATMKFVANHLLVDDGLVYDFKSATDASKSPLAKQLFTFPFIHGVFLTQNFVSLSKSEDVEWNEIMLEVREYLSNYLNAGQPVLSENAIPKTAEQSDELVDRGQSDHNKAETPIEEKIIEILDDYVRPAVEGDGGAIHYSSYSDGKLTVVLKGACSGCPSSTVTLKQGIQALFERMLPEVKEVIAEEQ